MQWHESGRFWTGRISKLAKGVKVMTVPQKIGAPPTFILTGIAAGGARDWSFHANRSNGPSPEFYVGSSFPQERPIPFLAVLLAGITEDFARIWKKMDPLPWVRELMRFEETVENLDPIVAAAVVAPAGMTTGQAVATTTDAETADLVLLFNAPYSDFVGLVTIGNDDRPQFAVYFVQSDGTLRPAANAALAAICGKAWVLAEEWRESLVENAAS